MRQKFKVQSEFCVQSMTNNFQNGKIQLTKQLLLTIEFVRFDVNSNLSN